MTDRESRVLSELRQRFNHVSAERVLSGPGIQNIYEALCEADEVVKQKLSPEEITRLGLSEEDAYCTETLDMFCAFLGTAASNVCITVGAYGGVYLAGGILPSLGDAFATSKFRKRFETKGRFSHYLESTPTYLITRPLPAMLGLKYLLEEL
jgi:glucokinase